MNTTIVTPTANNEFNFWARLPLGRKLQLAFAGLFVFTAIIAVVTLSGMNNVEAQYQQTLEQGVEVRRLANTISIELLTARRAEKNFQLRWQSEGYDVAYNNYYPLYETALKNMRSNINDLETHATAAESLSTGNVTEESFKADLTQLKKNIDTYEAAFNAEVEALGRRGYNEETGFQGQFRTAAQAIETEVANKPGLENLYVTYLELRRNEKDYLARGGQDYVAGVRTLLANLKSQISASDTFNATQKADLLRQADAYLTAFNDLVTIDEEIASHDAELIQAARAVEPITEKILNIGVELGNETTAQAETIAQQITTISFVITVIAFGLAILLSVFITQQLTRPILSLTATAQVISEGNFNVKADVTSADEVGALALTFNTMTTRLGRAFEDVRRRALAVQTSAEVSRRLTVATSPRQLAVDVVEQVQAAFNYYHAHIYFIDENTGELIMAGGTGEAGAAMLARGHKIPKGRGLVGRAAETNAPVLVPDVSKAEGWLPNPLLPETRSETAIPIAIGKQVLGVLDVQQNVVNGLGQEDVELLQSLAAQVAISLQNVRSYEESRSQAELEAMVNLIGQKIQRAATVEETLQTAIRELGTAMGAPRVRGNIDRSTSKN